MTKIDEAIELEQALKQSSQPDTMPQSYSNQNNPSKRRLFEEKSEQVVAQPLKKTKKDRSIIWLKLKIDLPIKDEIELQHAQIKLLSGLYEHMKIYLKSNPQIEHIGVHYGEEKEVKDEKF